MESESFSLALQQRAAREVVSEEMPRRALATRLLLFCEITSALLMIELGLFYQFWGMVFAFTLGPVQRYCASFCWAGRSSCSCDAQDLPFASIFTNPRYSNFGLRRGQKRNCWNAMTVIMVRVACASFLLATIPNSCQANPHECDCRATWLRLRECTLSQSSWWVDVDTALCRRNFDHGWQIPQKYFCSVVNLPEWMEGTCQAGHMDPLEYVYCREQMLYMEYCNAKFRVCAIFLNEASLDRFILQVCCIVPPFGLALMVLIHLAGFIAAKQTSQPSLMNMSENRELRQRIRTKACHFERQLHKEQLDHSIWWGRRSLEMNLLFFLLDICSDLFVLYGYFSADTAITLVFGSFQLAILLAGSLYQFWDTSFRKLFLATRESWKVGMPCNRLQKVLMRGKVIEAPLSLFLQYFSALYLDGSLLSLFLSMLSSIFGIANSFYISRHLAVREYDDVDDETVMKNTPAVCVIGTGEAKLPPPPGIKLPAPPGLNPILPAASNGRKPGQFASATE